MNGRDAGDDRPAEEAGEPQGPAGLSGFLRRNRGLLLRVAVFAAALGAAWLVTWRTGLLANLSIERLRAVVTAAGPLGYLLYAVTFVVGELVYVPAFVFIGVAAALWGKALAFTLAFVSGVLSAAAGFWVGRALGRRRKDRAQNRDGAGRAAPTAPPPPAPAARARSAWLAALDDRLANEGIKTVIYLRILFWLAPWLNMGLGLTRLSFRDYLVGTIIGVLPAVLMLTTVFHDVVAGGRSPASVTFIIPAVGLVLLFGFAFWRRRSLLGKS